MKKVIFLFQMIFLCVVLWNGYGLVKELKTINDEKNQFKELQEVVNTNIENVEKENSIEESSEETTINETETKAEILPEYAELYLQNADLCGWLRIEDSQIDYPVMYTPESPQFYLRRDWNKNDSSHGMLFISEDCDLSKSDNLVIYGHCMKDGTMFGSLKKYKDKSYYEKHSTIEYNTLYEKAQYQVISVFVGEAYYDEIPENIFIYYENVNFESQEDFEYFYSNIKQLSMYDTGIEAEYGDQFITLSTCSYEFDNARTVVVAKKIK